MDSRTPALISVVVPVYQEEENIQPFLGDLEEHLREPHEVLIIYDFPEDKPLESVAAMMPRAILEPIAAGSSNRWRSRGPNAWRWRWRGRPGLTGWAGRLTKWRARGVTGARAGRGSVSGPRCSGAWAGTWRICMAGGWE